MRFDKLAVLRARGRNPAWMVVSAAIHVLVLGAAFLYRPAPMVRTVRYIELGEARDRPLPAYGGPGGGAAAPHVRAAAPTPVAAPPSSPIISAVAEPEAAPDITSETDSLPVDTHRRLVPEYGDGRLWVRVEDVAAGRLPAKREARDVPTHVAKVDSALAEKIRSFLDTVPPDSFATRAAPKWTTEIAGRTWGIDGQWIYLGGVKIPTTVLAFLPLPSGNYDAARRAEQLQLMRQDIMEAAARAANAVEFKRYVKEVRQRKDEERAAREAPAPPVAQRDTTSKPPLIP